MMNTCAEIQQAFEDYQLWGMGELAGSMERGAITRGALAWEALT